MRIGILIRGNRNYDDWELQLLEFVRKEPGLDLVLAIKDCRDYNPSKISSSPFRKSKFEILTGINLFKKHFQFEKKRYCIHNKPSDIQKWSDHINAIPSIQLEQGNGFINAIDPVDKVNIKKYDLDVLLDLEYNGKNSGLFELTNFGIWTVCFSDSLSTTRDLAGFSEVLHKIGNVTVSLVKLTAVENEAVVIDQGYYNRHISSFAATNEFVLTNAISLIIHNLKRAEAKNQDSIYGSMITINSKSIQPGYIDLNKYIIGYYSNLLNGFIEKMFSWFGTRNECWTLFFGDGSFLDSDPNQMQPVELPKNECWADPFLFRHQGSTYVFFENYSYKTKKGKISCGLVKNNMVLDVVDVLDCSYHLSYPFIFEEGGQIYMMPETGQRNRLEVYKCIKFPNNWELYSTAFEGQNVGDATIHKDDQGQNWLFINKEVIPHTGKSNELYIYKFDTLKFDNLQPHKKNPIVIDSRIARNAGAIFKYKGEYYRPSQHSTDGIYGNSLNINLIEKLSLEEYVERTERIVKANGKKGFMSLHHLHQINDRFVFDSAHRRL